MRQPAQSFLFRPPVKALRTLIPVLNSAAGRANKDCVIRQVEKSGLFYHLHSFLFDLESSTFNLALRTLQGEREPSLAFPKRVLSCRLLDFGASSSLSERDDDTGKNQKCHCAEYL